MSYSPPRKLSVGRLSPHFDKTALALVDKVFVDGVLVPDCYAYDMDQGWAFSKRDGVWQPRVYGVVTVTVRS